MEAHQGEQRVTADLKPRPQQSEAGSVWEESLECTGGCRSDKELCGEAPQSLLYHHLTSMQKKVAHKPEGWGGGERVEIKGG